MPYTLPICVGFLFLGMSYGFLMRSMGSPCWINIKMSGWKKFYLIYGMCDETFSVNCTTEVPEGVDKGWFMFFVTLLNQIYWVGGATAGALLGYVIHFNTKGLEFVMTALFVVMFVNQWDDNDNNTGYSHNCSCGAWHNGDTVSAVFNFPGSKRTTRIYPISG